MSGGRGFFGGRRKNWLPEKISAGFIATLAGLELERTVFECWTILVGMMWNRLEEK